MRAWLRMRSASILAALPGLRWPAPNALATPAAQPAGCSQDDSSAPQQGRAGSPVWVQVDGLGNYHCAAPPGSLCVNSSHFLHRTGEAEASGKGATAPHGLAIGCTEAFSYNIRHAAFVAPKTRGAGCLDSSSGGGAGGQQGMAQGAALNPYQERALPLERGGAGRRRRRVGPGCR